MNGVFRISILLFFIFTFASCDVIAQDLRCAYVERYNPSTGKESAYRIKVKIEDSRLVEMHWSNGGHSDDGEFNPPYINSDVVSFKDYRGVQYKVSLIDSEEDCFARSTPLVRCTGVTKSGARCKRTTGDPSGKCFNHKN